MRGMTTFFPAVGQETFGTKMHRSPAATFIPGAKYCPDEVSIMPAPAIPIRSMAQAAFSMVTPRRGFITYHTNSSFIKNLWYPTIAYEKNVKCAHIKFSLLWFH